MSFGPLMRGLVPCPLRGDTHKEERTEVRKPHTVPFYPKATTAGRTAIALSHVRAVCVGRPDTHSEVWRGAEERSEMAEARDLGAQRCRRG